MLIAFSIIDRRLQVRPLNLNCLLRLDVVMRVALSPIASFDHFQWTDLIRSSGLSWHDDAPVMLCMTMLTLWTDYCCYLHVLMMNWNDQLFEFLDDPSYCMRNGVMEMTWLMLVMMDAKWLQSSKEGLLAIQGYGLQLLTLTQALSRINCDTSRRTMVIWWWCGAGWRSWWWRTAAVAFPVARKYCRDLPFFQFIRMLKSSAVLTWTLNDVAGAASLHWSARRHNHCFRLSYMYLIFFSADPLHQSHHFSNELFPLRLPQPVVDASDPKAESK